MNRNYSSHSINFIRIVKETTIGRWIKTALKDLEMDETFTAHSTRQASRSKAAEKGAGIQEIERLLGWTQKSELFAKFYNRSMIMRKNSFTETILDS